MEQTVEPIEAVIISGSRRGEIIRLPDETLAEVSGKDVQALNQALDELAAVIERVSTAVRVTIAALR